MHFNYALKNSNWSCVYSETDVNTAYDNFINIVTTAYEKSFPLVRLSRKRSKDKAWITSALKKSSKTKNNLYKKWITTRNKEDEILYKEYRAVYRKVALEAESLYYQQLFDCRNNNLKQLWNNLNSICSFKNKACKTNINELIANGVKLTDPADISNGFNDYFSSIGDRLVKELEMNNQGIGHNDFSKYCNKPIKNSMFLAPVTNEEIQQLIKNLRNGKSPGPDNIGPGLVKEASSVLCEPLLYIYNLSFSSGIVPSRLKVAKVIPIHKNGDKNIAGNYRPISLLSIFDKLLERIMYHRLYSYLQKHSILYRYQFGFRHNHSTSLALIEVVDNILQHLDNNEKIIGLYLDLQKAFDTVNHNILLNKLSNYGVRGLAHQWFKSYLHDRKQYTCINNANSRLANITCGVPQGSVLGPLLFLIYINDIGNAVPEETVKLFADDTNLFVAGKTIALANEKANQSITLLNQWFLANKLSLNTNKTCYMVFPPDIAHSVHVELNGNDLLCVHNFKYLGVVIDDELKWTDHIMHVYKKLLKFTGIFYKLRDKLPPAVLKNMYYAFVHSHVLYAVEIYANTCPTYLDKLVKLNNKILRIIQNKPFRSHVADLYIQYKTLPIPLLHEQQLLLFVYKVLNCPYVLPEVFTGYFDFNNILHSHNTRSSKNIHMYRANSTFGQRSLKYKAANLWNELPLEVKEQRYSSVGRLKLILTSYLLNQTTTLEVH